MESANQFSIELKIFEQNRTEWSRSHPGEFVVIQGDVAVEEFFDTYADALNAGIQRFGVRKEFLVKQVWMTEPVYCVS
jgi:hypothetical protein